MLSGDTFNYKFVSKGAKRLIFCQRLHAGLLAGRARASNMVGKSTAIIQTSSLKVFVIHVNYKSVSTGAKRLIFRQRLHA